MLVKKSLLDDAGNPTPVLHDNLEGWMGREVQEGADICIPVADPC